jgi:hypothetical protein
MPQEHCTITRDKSGVHAVSSKIVLTVVPDAGKEDEARAFNRNAIRVIRPKGMPERDRCLVGELDGVRVYAKDKDGVTHLVMTKEDLYL